MPIAISSARDGLRARLETIEGLRARDTLPDTIEPPMAVVWWKPPIEYDHSGGRRDSVTFGVTVFVGRGVARVAQDRLDAYVSGTGASSVKVAVEGDKTLGGTVGTCHVTKVVDVGLVNVAGVAYLAVEFEIESWG